MDQWLPGATEEILEIGRSVLNLDYGDGCTTP